MQRELIDNAEKLLGDLRERKLKVATAESCTGGVLAGALAAISVSVFAICSSLGWILAGFAGDKHRSE